MSSAFKRPTLSAEVKQASSKELPLAFLIALTVHLALFVIFSLLITEAKSTPSQAAEKDDLETDDLQLVFEPTFDPEEISAPEPETEVAQNSSPGVISRQFADASEVSAVNPEQADFQGAQASVAEGEASLNPGNADQAKQSQKASTQKAAEAPVAKKEPEFVEPDLAQKTLQDLLKDFDEKPAEEKIKEERKPKADPQVQLSINGEGSANIAKTARGIYSSQIRDVIVKEWKRGLHKHRKKLRAGLIIHRFTVWPDGRVENHPRVKMVGASQLQWGHIINVMASISLKPHSKEVRRELGGKPLVLTLTFQY